jgi:ribosomal protein S18 acetylase RimI-like enzyme
MNCKIRPLTLQDQPIVWTMLMHAAHETAIEFVQKQPDLSRYAENWGRIGDMGFVAHIDETPIGAAWLRLWSDDNRGYGYLSNTIPELAIAVLPTHRGQGVGTQLLIQILETAHTLFPAISLSVRADNPVVTLYQRSGFIKVEETEVINRTGGVSFSMIKRFAK